MKKRRAFVLVLVLGFSALLLLLAITYLSRNLENYRSASYAGDSLQAYELALAGLETARVRLDKDPAYPPSVPKQEVFSACEAVYEPDGVTVAGYYLVTVDTRWKLAPYQTVRLTSVGLVGSPGQPRARRKVWADLDVNPAHPRYYQLVHFRDEGSL